MLLLFTTGDPMTNVAGGEQHGEWQRRLSEHDAILPFYLVRDALVRFLGGLGPVELRAETDADMTRQLVRTMGEVAAGYPAGSPTGVYLANVVERIGRTDEEVRVGVVMAVVHGTSRDPSIAEVTEGRIEAGDIGNEQVVVVKA